MINKALLVSHGLGETHVIHHTKSEDIMMITNKKVLLVSHEPGATHVADYSTRLDMVLHLLDSSSLARSQDYHGSPGHLAALAEVEARIAIIKAEIAKRNEPATEKRNR